MRKKARQKVKSLENLESIEKIVSVAGTEHDDIVWYIARVCMALGSHVMVQDLTPLHELALTVPEVAGIDPVSGIVDYAGITYTCLKNIPGNILKEISPDVLIKVHGIEVVNDSDDVLIYVTDEKKRNTDAFGKLVCGTEKKGASDSIAEGCYLVIRDFTGAVDLYGDFCSSQNIGRDSVVAIPQSARDHTTRILLEHNQEFSFRHLSGALGSFLLTVVSGLYPGLKPKQILKVYELAAAGRQAVPVLKEK